MACLCLALLVTLTTPVINTLVLTIIIYQKFISNLNFLPDITLYFFELFPKIIRATVGALPLFLAAALTIGQREFVHDKLAVAIDYCDTR